MNFRNIPFLGIALLAAACCQGPKTESLTQWVDTRIGTGGHGHVFVGANVPYGAVQLGPTSIPQSWDWVSGYHISDTTVIGFSHTHLNGTGIGDLFDVTLMPVVGNVTYARGTEDDPQSGLWSYFTRANEKTRPGYYATHLDRYGIDVELTATKRVGLHKYTFPASSEAAVVIDLENGGCWDEPTACYLTRVDDRTVSGYRYSKGWANNQRIYFTAEFSKPFKGLKLIEGGENGGPRKCAGLTATRVYGRVCFDTEAGETIYAKVAISPVSIENAKANMTAELPGWDFDATVAAADQAWNDVLDKVRIETKDDAAKRIFYTALYHTMVAPSEFCDVNGDYRGSDAEIYTAAPFKNYTTFSLWDTYRAAQPLMTILHPEMMPDIAQTMLHIYRQQGKLPVWHLMGCETDCMVGNPGICAFADAVLKGYVPDKEEAYEALKASAMLPERGMDLRMKYGYIPCDQFNEAVAYDMEYAIADWAVAQVAQQLGKTEDYDYFLKRSRSYKHFFDPETHFMRGLDSKGKFRTPFNPFASTHREDDYCEGNAWQYTWLVPHDLNGLIDCFGSKEAFTAKLDTLFTVSPEIAGDNTSPDISGLIGQYAHGNEPSHHIVYFYTMIGQPWKTADKVRQILTTLYHDQPDGLSGNEDVGQMSAWYVLSSLGFYQVEPAGGRYFFGSPLFDRADVKVRDGVFSVVALNNSPENKYIQGIKLNGTEYTKPYIAFEDIVKGGTLEFEMGSEPAVWYEL